MGEEVFGRPTSRSTIRTIVYMPKEDVVKTMKLLSSPSDSGSGSSHEITTIFKPYSMTTAPSSPSNIHPETSVGSSTRPYRFASIERLVQRQKIYDNNTLPVVAHFDDTPVEYTYSLSQKREMFFRDNSTPPPPTANVLPNVPASFAPSVNNFTPAAPLYNSSNKENTSSTTYAKETSVKDMDGYVGFANLPNQIYRKAVKKGFEFTLMIVGEAGLGKSTLINSMFLTDIYSNEYPGPSLRPKKTTQVEITKVLLKENGVNLHLTVVDTPGFGDAVDNSECWQPITDFIENKYEEFLNGESRVHRSFEPDSRVHCCLYFIAPSGHGLKPLDVEFMKRLHDKVNIIPVLAKADTMTPEECVVFKKTILNDITKNKIKIYDFPDCEGEDEEESRMLKRLKDRVPFAVVGSNTVIEVNGKRLRGRKYPWGIAEVENMEHCDFIALRNMIIRTHMQDLKDVTNNVHYENYRCKKLAAFTNDGKPIRISNKNPLAQMEEEKKEHEQKMKKMEQEREQLFEQKVKEKFQKLTDSEADLERRNEQMKKNLEAQRKELEEKRKAFEADKSAFEALKEEETIRRGSVDVNMKDQQDTKEKKKEKKKGLF
ncbi:septin-7 [Caerostris darwini]|uniref:Septin-7 n=1 Tax=Caerostris darwini TaxID=1538125 RepID=A0AAV4S3Y6_9ARAC|nr:septin-7 [Caerostris darwini]